MSKPPSDMSEWQHLKTRSTRKIAFVHLPRLQQPKAGRKRPNYPRFRDFNVHFRVFPLNRSWLSGRYTTAPIVQWPMSHSRPLNWGKRTNAYVERAARMGIHLSLVCSHMRAFLGCVTTVADTHPYCLGSRTKSLLPQMFVNAVGRRSDGSKPPDIWLRQ